MIHHPGKTLAELIEEGVSPIIVPPIYQEASLARAVASDDPAEFEQIVRQRFMAAMREVIMAYAERIDRLMMYGDGSAFDGRHPRP